MKTTTFSLLAALLLTSLMSCKKESLSKAPVTNSEELSTAGMISPEYTILGCPITNVSLIAGQHIDAGNITVSNDADFIYVTYNTANGYVLTETHLYVGNCEAIPVTKQGNPAPGQFPYKNSHDYATSYSYQIPVSAIGMNNCGCIAAHAAVVKLDCNGKVIDSQTAWGNGSLINAKGNWGMKFQYCTCAGGQ